MKGLVFNNFFEMIENQHGSEILAQLIQKSDLPSGGTYHATNRYNRQELITLVNNLAKLQQTSAAYIFTNFGHYIFKSIKEKHTDSLAIANDTFDFLKTIEKQIPAEVSQYYPSAEFTQFTTQQIDDNKMELIYQSPNQSADFVSGLIQRTMTYYGEQGTVEQEQLSDNTVKFTVQRVVVLAPSVPEPFEL